MPDIALGPSKPTLKGNNGKRSRVFPKAPKFGKCAVFYSASYRSFCCVPGSLKASHFEVVSWYHDMVRNQDASG